MTRLGRDRAAGCDCNGPCMCAVPVPLLRWFAAQVSVYHGPDHGPRQAPHCGPACGSDYGQGQIGECGQPVRRCGICMLVTSLHRAAREHWPGVLP